MKKRQLAVLTMLAVGLAGCGKDGAPTNGAPGAAGATTPGATTFTGRLVSEDDVATRDVRLAAGQALRVKVTSDGELEPHLAVVGDVSGFEQRNELAAGEAELAQLAIAAGMPDGIGGVESIVERATPAATGRALVGSADFYRADPDNSVTVAHDGWLSFVAPQEGRYQLVVSHWGQTEAAGGAFTATLETTQPPAPPSTAAFDQATAGVLTLDAYKAAWKDHLGFLLGESFFDGKYELLDDCDAATGSSAPATPCARETSYYGPR